MLGLDAIDRLTGGRAGVHDTICPLCSPSKTARGAGRKVLRIWHPEPGWASYYCARCGICGFARDRDRPPPDRAKVAKARAEAEIRDLRRKAEQLRKAKWLWSKRRPIGGSLAETYL